MKTLPCNMPAILALLLVHNLTNSLQAEISVFISGPGIQTAEASFGLGSGLDIFTEDFNGVDVGTDLGFGNSIFSSNNSVTYTGGGGLETGDEPFVREHDQYGGHLQGNYLAIPEQSSITLELDPSVYENGAEYFGILFSAGDPYNAFRFYREGELVFEFSTQALIDLIPQGQLLETIDGTIIDTDDYYGQPNTGLNSGEPYAYLNFIAAGGTTFDTIVMGQIPGAAGSARLESDNHSIIEFAPPPETLPGEWIGVVPEPSSSVFLLIGAGLFLGGRSRSGSGLRVLPSAV